MKRRASRPRPRVVVGLATILAADAALAQMHASLMAQGYAVTSARLVWSKRSQSHTVRLVMRNRAAMLSTVTLSSSGFVLS